MFWDKVSGLYDFFEMVYNGKVYRGVGKRVAEEMEKEDIVLECACGTGAISRYIAPACRELVATDFSGGMLRQTAKNCRKYGNVKIKRADMTRLKCRNNRFDKVVAGNVIHLLEDPLAALKELERVCKTGGKIIVQTYINASDSVNKCPLFCCRRQDALCHSGYHERRILKMRDAVFIAFYVSARAGGIQNENHNERNVPAKLYLPLSAHLHLQI